MRSREARTIWMTPSPDHYLNVVAVKRADKDAPWAKAIVDAYRSPEFKATVDKNFAGYAKPAFLQ